MSIYRPDKHADPGHAARRRNQLSAEVRFYREFGSLQERLRHRGSLAWEAARSMSKGRFAEVARLLRAVFAPGRYNLR